MAPYMPHAPLRQPKLKDRAMLEAQTLKHQNILAPAPVDDLKPLSGLATGRLGDILRQGDSEET